MIRAARHWLLDAEPAVIPLEFDDRALLRSAVWGLPLRTGRPGRRRCHLRNLSARGLLRVSGRGQARCWALTERGFRAILGRR